MMSYEQVVELAKDREKVARKYNYNPFPINSLDVDHLKRYPFPNIGSYRPEGWELIDDKMVDKTGLGGEDEPALTLQGLNAWIKEFQGKGINYGMAIISEGEFQIVIGLFKPVGA